MSLNDVFQNVATIAFDVFDSIALDVTYIRSGDDLGWGDGSSGTENVLRTIEVSVEEDSVKQSQFYSLIQPTDIVVMVKGSQLREKSVVVSTSDTVKLVHDGVLRTFDIEGFDTDPAKAVYLILLRSVKA